MRCKLFILLVLFPGLTFSYNNTAYNDDDILVTDEVGDHLLHNTRSSSGSLPMIHKMIENAPNPVIPVTIFDFHHYSLNRRPFDNTAIGSASNSLGLSLHSVHPVISEGVDGMVKYYYENGETPPGATSSVWQFFMNASGQPSDYVPGVEDDRLCIYTTRRYRLSDIAADAFVAITNLGFVNSPDQWWFQVSLYNQETNDFDAIAPDYVLRDHPDAAQSKFSQLAINTGAIQTQSNERWCFKYDQPAVIRIKKGTRPVNEDEFVWNNDIGNIFDTFVQTPSITGYPHFTGFSDTPLLAEKDFWAQDKIQYIGIDLLREMFYDLDSPSFDENRSDAYIKNNALSATKVIWSKFVRFKIKGNHGVNDDFGDFINLVMRDKSINLATKLSEIKFESNYRLKKQLKKSFKSWATSNYKGILHGNIATVKNIARFKNSLKTSGVKKTLSSIKIKNPASIIKGYGPDSFLSLGVAVWSLADNIQNPGNDTSEIVLAYIPGISDGLTLFIDTSTKVNNFHAVGRIQGTESKSYNTEGFPYKLMSDHMMSMSLGINMNEPEACFYADMENLSSAAFCINETSPETSPQSYLSFVKVPENYWIKAVTKENGNPFYITESTLTLGDISSSLLPRGDVKFSLVKAKTIEENSDFCIYYKQLFKGVAQCYTGDLALTNDRAAQDLNIDNDEYTEDFLEQSAVKSIQKFSNKNIEISLENGEKALFYTSMPFPPEDIVGEKISGFHTISDEVAQSYFNDDVTDDNARNDNIPGRCEWMNNVTREWEPATWVEDNEETCNATDMRERGGGWYRWVKNALVVYQHRDFQGKSISITEDISYIGDEMNDKLSSFIIPGGWSVRFYEHADFQGRYYTRNAQSADSNFTADFNDMISSVKILNRN